MARIQPNDSPDQKSQEMLDGVKKMLGGTPNLFITLAHSPAALGVFVNSLGALNNSKLSGAVREQIALTVAGANGCDYCASAHTALGKLHRLDESELTANLSANSSNAKTQAALTFASQIVDLRGHVSDENLAAIRAAGYSDGEIVDIVAVVAVNIFTNYFNHIAGTEIDFPVVSTTILGATK